MITIGVYALAGFEVSPATVIGLLTILGYSLYDTVVVFDKVRENTAGLLGSTRSTYSQAANLALNQTLVRSINTSVIALLPVTAILFIGVAVLGAGELNDLALVLFVGMLSGTYSSIFIATPVLADLKEREPQYKALAKRVALRGLGRPGGQARRGQGRHRPRRRRRRGRPGGAAASALTEPGAARRRRPGRRWPTPTLAGGRRRQLAPEERGPGGPGRARGRPGPAPAAARGSSPGGPARPSAGPAARRSGARCRADAPGQPGPDSELAALIASRIRDIADYPQPGVLFKDITPLLADGAALARGGPGGAGAAARRARRGGQGGRDRGPRLHPGRPGRLALGAGFVPVRKQGKLPGPTYAQSYDLEYGSATIEVHQDAFAPGERVLIVDDVLATGGTAAGHRGTGPQGRRRGGRDRGHPGAQLPRPAGTSCRAPRSARCWWCDLRLPVLIPAAALAGPPTWALSGSSADRLRAWRT